MVTRCIRLNVQFSKADSLELKLARDDLRIAANRVITDLYLRGNNFEVAPETLAYRLMSGIKGAPRRYEATTPTPVGSGIRSGTASLVYDRWRQDRDKIAQGKVSLATFRRMPLCVRRQDVRVIDHERVQVLAWGRPDPRWVEARVWPAGRRHEKLWRLIVDREIKHADMRLQLDRRGRWYGSLAYSITPESKTPTGGSIEVEVVLSNLCGIHYHPDGTREELDFPPPANFWSLWQQWLARRREMGRVSRSDYERASGRGRKRKLRPLFEWRDRYERRVEDMARVMASAVVTTAKKRGASVAMKKRLGETQKEQDDTEDVLPRETRAEMRSRFLRRNRQRIMERVRSACEREGVQFDWISAERECDPEPCFGETAVAGREAEGRESRAASGDVIADSRQALDVSVRSRDASRDCPESRGSGSTRNRGARKRPPKSRGRRDLE